MDRLRARLKAVITRLSSLSPTVVATAALAFAGAMAVWFLSTTVFPYYSLNHDEGVYLQQADMLLAGRLFLKPPVEDVFLPWFFVEDGDRLYSKYTPVPAAIFALGKLAGSYRFALPAIAAANLALVAGVVGEAFDRRTGLVAAGIVLCSPLFLIDSAVFLPYAPTTALNLAFAFAYLRADRTGDLRWVAAAGAAVGLAFFARQYTAVLFALPFVAHALWTLRVEWRATLSKRTPTPTVKRQGTTAAVGLVGVTVTLGYNALMTGSPFVFPFHAFEPLDTVGFGKRRLTGYTVEYTLDRALDANRQVLELFVRNWLAGGVYTVALAAIGAAVATWRGVDGRQAALGGIGVTVVVGNVFFWGNYNILGEVGNGLVKVLGTRYHFDLLVPVAAFAAVGLVAVFDRLVDLATGEGRLLAHGVDDRWVQAAVALLLVVAMVPAGVATSNDLDRQIDRNMDTTRTYERVYDPFDGGPPANSLIFLPTPYGNWLNHPFQTMRNDPGYDGRAVYVMDQRVFEVADAFPDRNLYRYAYRGAWAPYDGSPDGARLQRVQDVSGPGVDLSTTVGVPDDAVAVTARLGTEDGSLYRVPTNFSGEVTVNVTVANGTVGFAERDGGADDVPDRFRIDDRENVLLTVFVDTGGGTGFTYRFDLPVQTGDDGTRALTPRVERCRAAHTCGGAAAHIPALAPEGVSVRTTLTARERNP